MIIKTNSFKKLMCVLVFVFVSMMIALPSVEACAAINGFVWDDMDCDGIQDNKEPGIPCVTVGLYDEDGNSYLITHTDDDGNYIFSSIPIGDYYVKFELKKGYCSFSPTDKDSDVGSDGKTVRFTLHDGNNPTFDAGMCGKKPFVIG